MELRHWPTARSQGGAWRSRLPQCIVRVAILFGAVSLDKLSTKNMSYFIINSLNFMHYKTYLIITYIVTLILIIFTTFTTRRGVFHFCYFRCRLASICNIDSRVFVSILQNTNKRDVWCCMSKKLGNFACQIDIINNIQSQTKLEYLFFKK